MSTVYHKDINGDKHYFVHHGEFTKDGRAKGLQFDTGAAGRSKKKPTRASMHKDYMDNPRAGGNNWPRTPDNEIPKHVRAHMKEHEEMTHTTVEDLLEAVVDQKPANFREIFEELMVEHVQKKIEEHAEVVADNFFAEKEDEEIDEEEEQIDEVIDDNKLKTKDKEHTVTTATGRKWKSRWYKPISSSDIGKSSASDVKKMDKEYRFMYRHKPGAGGQKEAEPKAAKSNKTVVQDRDFRGHNPMRKGK